MINHETVQKSTLDCNCSSEASLSVAEVLAEPPLLVAQLNEFKNLNSLSYFTLYLLDD